jgi:GNAT superfamily N-acetyltransferase
MAPSSGTARFDSLINIAVTYSKLTTTFRRALSLKTYSKRVNHSTEEPPSKKQRVEEPRTLKPPPQVKKPKGGTIQSYFKPLQPSSSRADSRTPHLSSEPLDGTPFTTTRSSQLSSDPSEPTSTPPSSPPPQSKPAIAVAQKARKRPKRRLTTRPILYPIVNMSSQDAPDYCEGGVEGVDWNADLHSSPSSIGPAESAKQTSQPTISSSQSTAAGSNNKTLHQTQLDIGGRAHAPYTRCKECMMMYNPTNAEDKRRHDRYHSGFTAHRQPSIVPDGVNVMDKYVDEAHHLIRVIDYRASAALKEHAEQALKATEPDLGGVGEPASWVWKKIPNPQDQHDPNLVPAYKVYLYLINLRVVGVLLAHRIARGGYYYYGDLKFDDDGQIPDEAIGDSREKQEFVYEDHIYKTYMCIDRIWVRKDMRRKGYATELVNIARRSFIPGMCLGETHFAFSRPTEMGRTFAEGYTGWGSDGGYLTDFDEAEQTVKDGKLLFAPC